MLREPDSLQVSDTERELKEAYKLSTGEQGSQPQSNSYHYVLHFYDRALAIYERTNCQHPKCMALAKAIDSLQKLQ